MTALTRSSETSSPLATLAGNAIAKDAYATGKNIVQRGQNPVGHGPNPYTSGELAEIEVTCDCGYAKTFLLPNPPPSQVQCPGCGKRLNVGTEVPTDEESASLWRNAPETGGLQ